MDMTELIKEKHIEEAGRILCDNDDLGEDSIKEQIKLVIEANKKDYSEMIDNVENVIVWEKREYTTTCHEFLEEIGFDIQLELIVSKLNDENIDFREFHEFMQEKEIGDWDRINDEQNITQYVSEMMSKGIHISHIIEAIETTPSREELYGIWLGNSMETPSPINTKLDLFEELGLKI